MRKLSLPLPLLLASSLGLGSSGCVTIQEGTTCAAQGHLSLGGICSHLISSDTFTLSFAEMVDFIDAQPDRTCVPVPGMKVCADDQTTGTAVDLPARGGAIITSAEDWGTLKTELETACREMGKGCSYAVKQSISALARRAR